MQGYSLDVAGIVCGIGIIAAALALRFRPHPAWRALLLVLSAAMLVITVTAIRQHTHRDERYARISAEQADVHRRLDALQAEIANSKGPVDPAVAKDRRDRLEALQRDLDAIRKESDELKNSGAAN